MTPEDKIYILRDGQPNEEGPFTINDVLSMYKIGRITSKDKYAMPGSTEWMSVSLLTVAFEDLIMSTQKTNQSDPSIVRSGWEMWAIGCLLIGGFLVLLGFISENDILKMVGISGIAMFCPMFIIGKIETANILLARILQELRGKK